MFDVYRETEHERHAPSGYVWSRCASGDGGEEGTNAKGEAAV